MQWKREERVTATNAGQKVVFSAPKDPDEQKKDSVVAVGKSLTEGKNGHLVRWRGKVVQPADGRKVLCGGSTPDNAVVVRGLGRGLRDGLEDLKS